MKDSANKKLAIGYSGHKPSPFDFSHDFNTSMEYGDVEPLMCEMMLPYSMKKVKIDNLTRTKPLVVAPYAKMSLKTFAAFVPLQKLWKPFASMMTQIPISDPFGVSYVPQNVPMIDCCELLNYVLAFSSWSVWIPMKYNLTRSRYELCPVHEAEKFIQPSNNPNEEVARVNSTDYDLLDVTDSIFNDLCNNERRCFHDKLHGGTTVNEVGTILSPRPWTHGDIFTDGLHMAPTWQCAFTSCFDSYYYNIHKDDDGFSVWDVPKVAFPLANGIFSAFGWREDNTAFPPGQNKSLEEPMVSIAGSDFCEVRNPTIKGTSQSFQYVVAYRLSDVGKRFLKLLIGLGYPIENMTYPSNNERHEFDSGTGMLNYPDINSDGSRGVLTSFGKFPKVSLLPLMAYYRAYYEFFGIQLYNAYENTPFFKVKSALENNVVPNNIITDSWFDGINGGESILANIQTPLNIAWYEWIGDLYQMWYVQEMDFQTLLERVPLDNTITNISQKFGVGGLKQTIDNSYGAVGQQSSAPSNVAHDWHAAQTCGFVDVAHAVGLSKVFDNLRNSSSGFNTHLAYQDVNHGVLDEKLLKILYTWTNRWDVIGKNIREALKAAGLGDYDEERDVYFCGYDKMELDVSEITSQSDNYDEIANTGRPLGDVAGKSVTYKKSGDFVYKTNEHGFFVVFQVLVPEAGVVGGVNHDVFSVDFGSFYQPDFDGKGDQAVRYLDFYGQCGRFKGRLNGTLTGFQKAKTFGYAPRMSAFKFAKNRLSGDFALNSNKSSMSVYHLDKMPLIDDVVTAAPVANTDTTKHKWDCEVLVPYQSLSSFPAAGLWYRFPWRFKGMSNFERIFVTGSTDRKLDKWAGVTTDSNGNYVISGTMEEYTTRTDSDPFICQNKITEKYVAPMIPYQMSLETFDEEKGANGSVNYMS